MVLTALRIMLMQAETSERLICPAALSDRREARRHRRDEGADEEGASAAPRRHEGTEGLQIPPLCHSLAVVQAGRDLPCCSLLLLLPETDTGVRRHRLLDMSPGQLQDIRRQVGGQ